MDDLVLKLLLAILFVAIVIVIIYYGITDPLLQTTRLYTYIFSIVIPLIGILLFLKEDIVNAGIANWWYISIFLGGLLAVTAIIALYYYLPTGSTSLFVINSIIFLFLFLIVAIGLAIIYNIGEEYFSKQTGLYNVWIQVLFYIPCLISDFILYIFEEFSIIPNMVFVLFIIEIVLVLMYVYGEDVANKVITNGGKVLLADYRQLNSVNTIADSRQFQIDSPSKNMDDNSIIKNESVCLDINGVDALDSKFADHSVSEPDIPYTNPRKPTLNGIDDPGYKSTGIDDPKNDSCKFNPYLIMDVSSAVQCGIVNIEDIRDLYNRPDLYNSIAKTVNDNYMAQLNAQTQPIFNTNYSITFWVYLNPKPEIFKHNHEYNILNYANQTDDYQGNGGNPKVTFLNDSYNVYFTNNPKCLKKGKYNSECMYNIKLKSQKWNYFVFNYSSGHHVDLFINGILEKTYKFSDNIPVYSNSDQINIGELNGAYGYICNVMYYSPPLMKSQIANFYNLLSVRDPPILKM
jgi:hypothetical protein